MELSKCVIFVLNILIYSGRIDFVFLHRMHHEGSSKSSETDGYAKNVENLVNDKRTINTLKKINSGKPKNNTDNDLHAALTKRIEMKEKLSKMWLPAVHKIWKYWHKSGARQVMNTITSKLIRHASDKITKHVGNIIRTTVSSKKSLSVENAQLRSPIPLSSTTEVVIPALSIAKLNEKGSENTTLTTNVQDLKPAQGTSGNAPTKSNNTTPIQNNATQTSNSSVQPQIANLTSNVTSPDNSNLTSSNNHSFTIKYESDSGDIIEAKPNAAHVMDNSSVLDVSNSTTNASVVKLGNGTKYSDVPAVRPVNPTLNTSSNGTSRSVPILAINTDESKSPSVSNKASTKKQKHKSEFTKTHGSDEKPSSSHQRRKHHKGNMTSQHSKYKVYPGRPSESTTTNVTETSKAYYQPEKDEIAIDGSGILSLDLSGLTNKTSSQVGIHSIDVEDKPLLPPEGDHADESATFTLGHNHLEELPQDVPEKGPLHSGHNHAGEAGIDHNLPQDALIAGHEQGPLLPGNEQGPLLPGHEQGPLLPGQDHPGDFLHHENDYEDELPQSKLHGAHALLDHVKWNHHSQPSGPNYVEEPLQVPPVPAEINPGIPNAVNNLPNGQHHLTFNLSPHPILSLEGIVQPLNNAALLQEEEKVCTQRPPLAVQVGHQDGSIECTQHHEYPFHTTEEMHGMTHHEEAHLPTVTPTLPFEIPSHHKFEKLGHHIEPELLSIIESNNQQVTSLSHEVKNIESRLGNVESIVEVLEKAVYRIEEKVDKLDRPASTYTQREEFSDSHVTEEPPHNTHHSPLLKQYYVPISPSNNLEGIKEIDHGGNNAGLPWPVNKVVAYLLQEIQKNKILQRGQQQPLLQLQNAPHVPLPQPEMAYPPKEHDIDRLEYEIGRTPKNKFGHKAYHYEALENQCQCENGGECSGRNDVCDCPLRFTGPRCERPVPRSSLLDSIIDEIPTDTQQQQYHAPKKTSLITLPLVISENNDEQDPIAQKTVGEVNQSKLVNLLSQFFSPDYLQRFAKREKVSQRRYVKYPLEKEK